MIFRTRKMVMPADLNGAGSLFGGRCLSWVDEEAAIYATCQLETHRLVTAGMSAINFTSPAYQNNIIEIGSGYSSCVMMDTNDLFFDGNININFIEPYPKVLNLLMRKNDKNKYSIML
jgi:hypothetical protein